MLCDDRVHPHPNAGSNEDVIDEFAGGRKGVEGIEAERWTSAARCRNCPGIEQGRTGRPISRQLGHGFFAFISVEITQQDKPFIALTILAEPTEDQFPAFSARDQSLMIPVGVQYQQPGSITFADQSCPGYEPLIASIPT